MKKIYNLSLMVAAMLWALVGCTGETEYVTLVQPSVLIEDVQSPNAETVTAHLVPNESSASFCYAIGAKGDREAFLDGSLNGIEWGESVEAIDVVFDGLKPQTQYTIYAVSFAKDGKIGALSSYIINSYDAVWSVEPVYVAANNLSVEVEISTAIYRMDYYLGKPGEADKFKNDEIVEAESITETTYKCFNFYDLEENTDYVFYTKFYDRRGKITEVNELELTTLVLDEMPAVELTMAAESDVYVSTFTFTPNEHCGVYYILPGEVGQYANIFDGANGYAGNVYNMILNWRGEDWGVYTLDGEHTFDMYNMYLTSSVDYEFYALCCDENDEPKTLQRFFKSSTAEGQYGVAEVDIEEIEINSEGASFKITPNENTVGCLFSTFTKVSYDGYWGAAGCPDDVKAFQLSQWQAAVANGSVEPWHYGSDEFEYSEVVGDGGIKAGTDYCVVVTPINGAGVDNGGWGTVEVYYFTIPAEEVVE